MIDKPILELLTFDSNLDVVNFLLKKPNFQAVIKSAASAASLETLKTQIMIEKIVKK